MTRIWIAAVLCASLAPAAPVRAEVATACTAMIVSLPTVIAARGVYCLDTDLAADIDSGAAITVLADRVTIACHGYSISGVGASPASIGIHADGRALITVRDCGIERFGTGIHLTSDATLVEGNRVSGNVAGGIRLAGDGNIVRDNAVMSTGFSTVSQAALSAVHAQGGTDVVGNVIQMIEADESTPVYGIRLVNGIGARVADNFVRCHPSLMRCTAIHAGGSRIVVEDNRLIRGAVAIRCTAGHGSMRGNSVRQFQSIGTGCVDDGGNIAH